MSCCIDDPQLLCLYLLSVTGAAILHQTLGEQESWLKPKLLSWKLELNRQTMTGSKEIMKAKGNGRPKVLMRTLTLVISAAIFLHSYSSLSPFKGTHPIFSQLVRILRKGFDVPEMSSVGVILVVGSMTGGPGHGDILSLFLWLLMMCVSVGLKLKAFPAEMLEMLPYLAASCFLTSLFNYKTHQKKKKNPKAPKKPYRPRFESNVKEEDLFKEEVLNQDLLSGTNTSNSAKSLPKHPISICGFHEGEEFHINNSGVTKSRAKEHRQRCDISSLSIADSDEEEEASSMTVLENETVKRRQTPATFQLRNYEYDGSSSFSSDIDFGDRRARRPIIQPSKFRPQTVGVAKASWVAGGYWGGSPGKRAREGSIDDPSRSSSQSSGFVSCSENQFRRRNLFSGGASNLSQSERLSLFSEPIAGAFDSNGLASRPSSQMADSSFDSNLGRLTQEAFSGLQPRAESSPMESREAKVKKSWLEREVLNLKITPYNLLLAGSVGLNVALAVYFAQTPLLQ